MKKISKIFQVSVQEISNRLEYIENQFFNGKEYVLKEIKIKIKQVNYIEAKHKRLFMRAYL